MQRLDTLLLTHRRSLLRPGAQEQSAWTSLVDSFCDRQRVIARRVIARRVIVRRVTAHRVIAHRVIVRCVIVRRVIVRRVIAQRAVCHRAICHRALCHRAARYVSLLSTSLMPRAIITGIFSVDIHITFSLDSPFSVLYGTTYDGCFALTALARLAAAAVGGLQEHCRMIRLLESFQGTFGCPRGTQGKPRNTITSQRASLVSAGLVISQVGLMRYLQKRATTPDPDAAADDDDTDDDDDDDDVDAAGLAS